MTPARDTETSAWENFDASHMGVMRVKPRANHPTRFFTDELIRKEFGRRHFRWLDIGVVGMVDYERLVGKLSFTYTGVDRSPSIIEDSRRYLRQEDDRILPWNVENPIEEAEGPLVPAAFDLITARHILNHCSYYEQPLLNMHRLMDDRGLCVITLHLRLIDDEDQLESHTRWSMPGVVIGNLYNKDKFLRYLVRHFHIEHFVRFDDGRKPNDVLVARKRQPGTGIEALPEMEVRRHPATLRSRWVRALPRPVKDLLKTFIVRR